MEEIKIKDYRLKFPFSMLVCGSPFSGKTTFVLNLIEKCEDSINQNINNIVYFYGEHQPLFTEFAKTHPHIYFVNNVEEAEKNLIKTQPSLYILDDLLTNLQSDKKLNDYITKYFVQKAHHCNTSIILLVQNIFPQNTRTISLNATYIILMRQIRDKRAASYLGSQIKPHYPNFIPDALEQATQNKRGAFLVIDLHHDTVEEFRVRNFIWISKDMRLFLAKEPVK
jgi:uridine kinase